MDPARWQEMFEALMGRIEGRFGRVEPRRRAREFVLGLLSDLPRKNCWTLAEHAGDATPHGLQHLLSRAKWDADAVRDDIRGFVVEQLRDDEAVLVVDETGDLKKGTHTVAVQRRTPALPDASKTARSPSTSPIPPRAGTRQSTGNSTSPAPGPRTPPAARPPGFPIPSPSPPDPPSPPT